jgi:hypothetical protein
LYNPGSLLHFLPCPVSENALPGTEPRYNVEILYCPLSSTNDGPLEGWVSHRRRGDDLLAGWGTPFSSPHWKRKRASRGEQHNGLTFQGLAQQLQALERENERMRSENAELQHKVATPLV